MKQGLHQSTTENWGRRFLERCVFNMEVEFGETDFRMCHWWCNSSEMENNRDIHYTYSYDLQKQNKNIILSAFHIPYKRISFSQSLNWKKKIKGVKPVIKNEDYGLVISVYISSKLYLKLLVKVVTGVVNVDYTCRTWPWLGYFNLR